MRRWLVIAALLVSAVPPAAAGTLEQEYPLEGTLHWGPFRVRPYYMFKDTGYDSNVFLEDSTATSDFTSTAELGIKAFSLFRNRGVVQMEERLDYVWYLENNSLNHFNNAFRGAGGYYLKRGQVFAELETISYRERPSTEIDFRVRRHERLFGTGWRFIWPRSSLRFRLGRDRFDYDSGSPGGESIPRFLNRVEKKISVTGSKQILPKTLLMTEWEARRIGFDDPEGQVNDSSSRRLSLGFVFDPSAFLRGTVKIGIERLTPDEETREAYDGPVGDATLVYRVTGGTAIEGRWRKNIYFTTAVNNVYYVDKAYGGTLTQVLADRLAGEVGIDREQVDFPVETSLFNPDTGLQEVGFRVDEIRSYFGGVSYKFSNLTRLGIRVGVWERSSTFDFLNRHRLTAGLTYTYNF